MATAGERMMLHRESITQRSHLGTSAKATARATAQATAKATGGPAGAKATLPKAAATERKTSKRHTVARDGRRSTAHKEYDGIGELTAETENYDRGAYLRELQHEYEEEVEAEEQAEKSIISAISTSSAFEYTTLSVICLNAFWIGCDQDKQVGVPWMQLTDSMIEYPVIDNFFCSYFTAEVVIRFMAFEDKISCIYDHWFTFDFVLVCMMIVETWVVPLAGSENNEMMSQITIFRLLRLLRLTRLVRIVRAFPELVKLLKGMVRATRSVAASLVLLSLVTYVFAIIFRERMVGVHGNPMPDEFGSILRAMLFLFLTGTLLDDITDVLITLWAEFKPELAIYLFYVVLSSFTILNMLIGVMVDVITLVSKQETEKAMIMETQLNLMDFHQRGDADASGHLSISEFKAMCKNEEVEDTFRRIGVESRHLEALASVLFMDGEKMGEYKELDMGEFVESVVMLRPEKVANTVNVAELRSALKHDLQTCKLEHGDKVKSIRERHKDVDDELRSCLARIEIIDQQMDAIETNLNLFEVPLFDDEGR
jgi:voltage-gated sodium channel